MLRTLPPEKAELRLLQNSTQDGFDKTDGAVVVASLRHWLAWCGSDISFKMKDGAELKRLGLKPQEAAAYLRDPIQQLQLKSVSLLGQVEEPPGSTGFPVG